MAKIYIGILLHAYQPPTQTEGMLKKIFHESYLPLISLSEREPSVYFSMDLAKSLGERLPEDFRARIRTLYEGRRIELLNTCAYHYLAPITPSELLERQLRLNEEFYRENFIGNEPLPGIFPPELAFSPELPAFFKKLGYSWCLADDEPFVHMRRKLPVHEQAPYDWIPFMHGFGVMLRSGMRSKEIAFHPEINGEQFADALIHAAKEWGKRTGNEGGEGYTILALDAETFGHHLHGTVESALLPFCKRIAERDDAAIVPLNSIFSRFIKKPAYVPPGSWSTGNDPVPYPLWDHPENKFHRAWNEFIRIACAMRPYMPEEAEKLFDTSFYSCTPWQYSMGHKNVARWCLINFMKIADSLPEGFEKFRLKELTSEMDRLTQ